MKKPAVASTTWIAGRLDSLTDVLKQLLFQYEPQSVEELLPQARAYLGNKYSSGKMEKNLYRCLLKNPSFYEQSRGLWALDLKGNHANEEAYHLLKQAGHPLTLREINDLLRKQNSPEVAGERQLVYDGRFVRLKKGNWALVSWQVKRVVTVKELDQVAARLRGAGIPLSLAELSAGVLECAPEKSDLLERLEGDSRFIWVGGDCWYLSDLPGVEVAATSDDPWAFLREGERAALQGAELMLTFQDTDPNRHSYILSSEDLERGCLRLTRRMEKFFAGLPEVAWLKMYTSTGPVYAWYLRQEQVVAGLSTWMQQQELVPGSRLEIRRTTEEGQTYELVITGEREAEVYAEARRIEQLKEWQRSGEPGDWPRQELLVQLLELFPEGLGLGELQQIAARLVPEMPSDEVVEVLHTFPFFEEVANDTWCFNQKMLAAYDHLRKQAEEARQEVAACLSETRTLVEEKEQLLSELDRLRLEHQDSVFLQSRTQQLVAENQQLRSELEKLHRRKEQLRAELSRVEEELDGAQAEKEALAARAEQLESRVLQLQGSFNKALSKSQAEYNSLKEKLKEVERRLQGALEANQDLQRVIADLQEERLELRRRLSPWPVKIGLFFSRMLGLTRGYQLSRSRPY